MTLGTLPSRSPQAWARCAREGVSTVTEIREHPFFGGLSPSAPTQFHLLWDICNMLRGLRTQDSPFQTPPDEHVGVLFGHGSFVKLLDEFHGAHRRVRKVLQS